MTPILVTGAAGFIGFHACLRLLGEGRAVVGIDNLNDYYDPALKQARLDQLTPHPAFTFIRCDIAGKGAMEKLWRDHGPFAEVVHLAAQAGVRHSLQDPYSYIHSNCLGHLTVLEMCRHTPGFRHLVYASSSSVYGGNDKRPYAPEDSVDHPLSLYAATKRADELMSHSYAHLYRLPQTALRFFTVYGPWGRPDMAPHIFTQAIDAGSKVAVYNNGRMKRDFTYIDDAVSMLCGVLSRPPDEPRHRVLNIGNTRSENLMDFIGAIEQALGKQADIDFNPLQPGDAVETCADMTATAALTGLTPATSIREGVPHFVAWYKDYYRP